MLGSLHVAYSVQLAAGLDGPLLRGDGVCGSGTNGWTPPQDSLAGAWRKRLRGKGRLKVSLMSKDLRVFTHR